MKLIMKTFKQFNESVKDFLKPKSEEEIENALFKLSDFEKIIHIIKNKLLKKYLPKNTREVIIKKIKSELNKYTNNATSLFSNLGAIDKKYPNIKKVGFHIIKNISLGGLYVEPVKRFMGTNFKGFEPHYNIPFENLSTSGLLNIIYILLPNSLMISDMDLDYHALDEGSVMDFLKPKSDEDIRKNFDKLNTHNKLGVIRRYKLGNDYMPSDEEIKNLLKQYNIIGKIQLLKQYGLNHKFRLYIKDILEELPNNDRIRTILREKLPFKYLPRNDEGRCILNGGLNVSNINIQKLPDNLTVDGNLFCRGHKLKELPKGLIVKYSLYLNYGITKLKIPEDAQIGVEIIQ